MGRALSILGALGRPRVKDIAIQKHFRMTERALQLQLNASGVATNERSDPTNGGRGGRSGGVASGREGSHTPLGQKRKPKIAFLRGKTL